MSWQDEQQDKGEASHEEEQNGAGQWYSSFYQNDGSDMPPVVFPMDRQEGGEVKKASKKKKGLLIALSIFLAFALLIGSAAGGAWIVSSLNAEQRDNSLSPVGGGNSALGGDVYSAESAASYDYATVSATIEKNDGAALGSARYGSAGDSVKTPMEVAAEVKDSVVEVMTTVTSARGAVSAGAGSGVIIHADGVIVTNHHVVDGSDNVYVRLTNGNTYEAYVRGVDEDGDIAVLKITPKETLTVARLGYSAALKEMEEVIVIGNPLGQLGGTITHGYISALDREIPFDDGITRRLLQTDAAINGGNSGGGLFNMAGELVGIVEAKYSAVGVEGLGFAIPIDTAYTSIGNLLSLGYIPGVPSLGVKIVDATISSFPFSYAVVSVSDPKDSSAFAKNDIILSVDGTSVSSVNAVKSVLRSHKIGDSVSVVVSRGRDNVTLSVTLVQYIPADMA